MTRMAPLAAALALSLACPEVLAGTGGPVPRAMASWSAPGYEQPAPQPAPAPAPQPYADPSAPAPAPAPQPYADPSATAAGPQPGTYAPPPTPRKRRKGLMIAGWTMLGASYLATAFISLLVRDGCLASDNERCLNVARVNMIPVAGPFIGAAMLDTEFLSAKIAFSIPGLIQVAGLTMGIIGTVQFVRDGREPRYVGVDGFKLGPRLRLGAAPTRFYDGGTVTLGYRF